MDSKPEYDSWYAPIHPIVIHIFGAILLGILAFLYKFLTEMIANPQSVIPLVGMLLVFCLCYIIGLVSYHVGVRIL